MRTGQIDRTWEDELARDIVLDHFGDVAADVVATLLQRGEQTFSEIHRALAKNDLALPANVLRRTLAILIQHGIVTYGTIVKAQNVRNTYSVCTAAALRRLRYPKLVLAAGDVGGHMAEMVLEVLLESGIATVARIVNVVCERCAAAAEQQQLEKGDSEPLYSSAARRHDAEEAVKALKRLVAATYIVRAVKDSLKTDAAAAGGDEFATASEETLGSSRSGRSPVKRGRQSKKGKNSSNTAAAAETALGFKVQHTDSFTSTDLPPELQVLIQLILNHL